MRSLTLVRRIAARPSIVFEAMTTAEGVAAWFGPDDLPVVGAQMDARVGGAYRVHFRTLDGRGRGGDGDDHEACGEFLELVPPRRIVMSWKWAFGGVPEERGRTSRIEIELTPIPDGTEVTFTHTALWNEASEKSHTGGWTGALNKLVRHLEGAALLLLSLAGQACAPSPSVAPPGAPAPAQPAAAPPRAPMTGYPSMQPLAQYSMKPADETALARTAAPASISADAEILVLGSRGYEAAVPGKNGFVCFVERSWASPFASDEFWNPRIRAPNCFNPAAARTVLPPYLKRTEWVLAGSSKQALIERTKAAFLGKEFVDPEPASFSFMMSAQGHLSDADGHWHPHVMFFVPRAKAASWGANLPGSPIMAQEGDDADPVTIFFIPVRKWSDGSLGPGLALTPQ